MKPLLVASAGLETATGLALLVLPSLVASSLLGAPLDMPGGLAVARVAGAALLSLGVACWLARNDGRSRAAVGLVTAMLLYNVAAVAILAFTWFGLGLSAPGLWPAMLLHVALAVWCIACISNKK